MSVTAEILFNELGINANTLKTWEIGLGLNTNTNAYSDEKFILFKKVKSLLLNGYTLDSIKDLLSSEIEMLNDKEIESETIIIQKSDIHDDAIFYTEKLKTERIQKSTEETIKAIKESVKDEVSKSEMLLLFETVLKELKQYTERTIEAEKKLYLLENHENKTEKDFDEISSELKRLKAELEDKEQKLKDYEEQKKRLNLMEIQLKILQIEKNKKKSWEFWK